MYYFVGLVQVVKARGTYRGMHWGMMVGKYVMLCSIEM